jgi:hypothetical protein
VVPPADFPDVAGAAEKRFAPVLERDRASGFGPARVPEITDVAPEELRGGRHENLEGLGALAPDGTLNDPREPWAGGIDADRLGEIFTAQADRRE